MLRQARKAVIRNGTLISGTGEGPRPNGVVLLEGGKIRAVRPAAAADDDLVRSFSRDAEIIDAGGQFILPGLIDGHAHLSLYQGAPAGVTFPSSAEYATLLAAEGARACLRAGVTSVSVPGGAWFVDVNVREAVNSGLIEGPRIFCAGRFIGPYGGIGDNEPAYERGHQLEPEHWGILCNTPEEYVVEVRRQVKHGVDMIKLADSTYGDLQVMSLREIEAATEEAHRLKVPVCIHARGSGSIRDAAMAKVDWIFHADLATEADLDVVAKHGIPLMPAFTQGQLWARLGPKLGVPQGVADRMLQQAEVEVRAIASARKRGIRILIGTDAGNGVSTPLGTCHGYEGAFFVKYLGYSPLEVINTYTRENSVVMGLEGKLGTIESGMIADIIVLDRDPTQDISVLGDPKHVRTVIRDGRVVDLEGLTPNGVPVQVPFEAMETYNVVRR